MELLARRDKDGDFAGESVRAVCCAKTDLRDGARRAGKSVQCREDRCAVCTHRRSAIYAGVAVLVGGRPDGPGRAWCPAQRACRLSSAGGPTWCLGPSPLDRKSTRLNSSHTVISYAVFCLKK